MQTERRIVDNRVFLLGLDELYRESMKTQEQEELLRCARATAQVLSVKPVEIPVEGYYSEDARLTKYFCLVRALQQVPKHRESEVESIGGYQRLKQVVESPIFGLTYDSNFLLTGGRDSLSMVLKKTFPEWNIENLTNTAYQWALDSDDFSLVTLAALSRDAVVLAALRESTVLYAEPVFGCLYALEPEYVWQVDDVIQSRAQRFVTTFNELFDESLPQANADNAAAFWWAYDESKIAGRCVRMGYDNSVPPKQYHWGIDHDPEKSRLIVKDFWDTDVWTTQRYRQDMKSRYCW